MLSTPVLPQEILALIVRLLRRNGQALLNLCLTSSCFLGEARNLLYSDIRIRESRFTVSRNNNPIPLEVAKSDKLFVTLTAHNTSLAALVQTFAYLADFPCNNDEYMSLVNRTFRLINNVKHLTLCSDVVIPGLFDGCTFQLESLCCTATDSLKHSAGQNEICRFLSTQPNLKSLLLDWQQSRLPLTLCPKLETIRGGNISIECLLPGRSTVRHLEWIRHETYRDLPIPIHKLSAELSNMTVLALGGINDRIPLRSLTPYLKSLRVLRLMGFAKGRGIDELEHDVSRLSKLQILALIIRLLRHNAQALLNLCLTSSCFIGEARNLLYSEIRIRKSRFTTPQNSDSISIDAAKSDKLLTTLTTHNTSLAALVQSFACLTDFPCNNKEYTSLVNRTFRLITNVKRLTVCCGLIVSGLFDGCTFQLESLCCTATGTPTRAAAQDEICHFLSSQPNLKSILLDWPESPRPFTLKLDTTREVYHPLSTAALSNVTVLALKGMHDRIPLRSLIPYLNSLRVLRLMGFGDWGMVDLENNLPKFSKLHTFVWSSGSFRLSYSNRDEYSLGQGREQQKRLTDRWFTKMDSLDKVYFQACDIRFGVGCYTCWRRGDNEPVYVDHKETLVANGLSFWFG
ncbi:hypothetical protein AGABI1DRAFT_129998 [Agaricus bisporus var. burnettii JB137-S8]|uniref:Uncharacterized protein n=1 Tax=Agaricus bisporus var. burnettii (strain JB137-S8 / ATCC MYA-4627 / FGSC 10392) TaxID=597362 RepID=K5XS29_AGABU|nr:uncharacterized protein AGABI1DRAFT_129998 [Agaricus bisporus var. burnettii JB137-S8]EKM77715.1 hypothetical protein AGABI1DRAFT_129998 [Agaricus bisporus var. burnettii JB137-S8]